MTIPSRPAPPPPQQSTRQNASGVQNSIKHPTGYRSSQLSYSKISSSTSLNSFATHSSKRYEATTDFGGNLHQNNGMVIRNKKIPPPRPPPPKANPSALIGDTVLKKPGPPQSVNVLSNIFGKKRANVMKKQAPTKISHPPLAIALKNQPHLQRPQDSDFQLINFDSPPSSPTLTQKSNSDCVSIDSFSSDSNFSSPNNGSTSQPESGFEDDFANPADPWEAIANDPFSNTKPVINDLRVTQPVRNLHAINKTQADDVLCNGKSLLPPPPALTMPTIIKPKASQNLSNIRNSSPIYTVFGKEKTSSYTEPKKNVFKNSDYLDDSLPSPPMPSCPPPPPPSTAGVSELLGIVTGKLDAIDLIDDSEMEGPSYGIALYDFEGLEDQDLSFRENEKIYILQRLNEEWYLGRNRSGCEGIFPTNYIDVKVPLKESRVSENIQLNAYIATSTSSSHKSNKVRALYKFTPEASDDLPLNVNDMVTVLYRINDDWLYGEIGNQRGQFPANFIEYIPENLSQMKSN